MAQTVKNLLAKRDTWVWIPGLGRSPGGGHDNPLQYSCLENPLRQRSLVGYSPRSHRQSDTTERLSTGRRVGASGNLTGCLKGISGCSKIVLFSPHFISLFPSISLFCLKFSTPLCSLFGDLVFGLFPFPAYCSHVEGDAAGTTVPWAGMECSFSRPRVRWAFCLPS